MHAHILTPSSEDQEPTGLKVDIAELTASIVRKDQNTQKAEKRTVTSVLLKEGWGGGGVMVWWT